jgi:hypothetical protein
MLRVVLTGLVVTWGLSLTRLVRSRRMPATVPVDPCGRRTWTLRFRHARV